MVSQHGLALHCGTLQRRRIRLARIWVTPALSQRLEQSAVTQTRLRRRFAFQAALQFHVRWLLRPKCHRPRPPLQYPHHLSLRAGQIFALSPTPDQVRPRVWLSFAARRTGSSDQPVCDNLPVRCGSSIDLTPRPSPAGLTAPVAHETSLTKHTPHLILITRAACCRLSQQRTCSCDEIRSPFFSGKIFQRRNFGLRIYHKTLQGRGDVAQRKYEA